MFSLKIDVITKISKTFEFFGQKNNKKHNVFLVLSHGISQVREHYSTYDAFRMKATSFSVLDHILQTFSKLLSLPSTRLPPPYSAQYFFFC